MSTVSFSKNTKAGRDAGWRQHLWLSRIGGQSSRLLIIAAFTVFMAAPVVSVMARAFSTGHAGSALSAHEIEIAFRNTLLLGVLVALGGAIIAYLLAWAMLVTRLADNPLTRVLCMVPFMGAPYLMSIGWILFMEPNGYLVRIAPWLHTVTTHFFSLWGLVTVMILHLFPISFVSALQSMRVIQNKYEAPAKVHGAGFGLRLLRIWIPLSAPALAGSSMLVFVKTIGEFGTPLVFGSLLHFPVLTTTIYLQMSNWPIDFHAAAQLSGLLLGTVLMVWVANDAYQRKMATTVPATVGQPQSTNRWLRFAGYLYMGLLGLVSLGIPIGSLVVTSLLRIQGDGLHFANMSLIHYRHIFQTGTDALGAIWTTVELSVLAATAVLVLALVLVTLSRFYASRVVRLTEWIGLLPNSIPDVLLVIGMIFFWNAKWWPVTPYNTSAMLVIGYSVVLFPFSYTYIRAALFRLRPTVWESALVHQGKPWRVATRVIGPLLTPAMVAGWMMVFAISLRDLVVPMLLSPPNTTVVATYIYGQFDQGSLPDAMALAVITLGLTIAMLTVVQWSALRGQQVTSADV